MADLQTLQPPSGILYEHDAPQSFKSKGLKLALRLVGLKNGKLMKIRIQTGKPGIGEAPEPPKRIFKMFNVTPFKIRDQNVFTLEPKTGKANKTILFIHGGAFIYTFLPYHWDFFEKLMKDNNCNIIVPDYPLAPNYSYLDTFEFLDALYQETLPKYKAEELIFMGDSAGGNITLAFAQRTKQQGLPQPRQIILLSPGLDLTLTNPEILEIEKDDVVLSVKGLRPATASYANGADQNIPILSPMNGALDGLGRISIFTGTHDILHADAKTFKAICDRKGLSINYYVYPKMIHDFMIFGMKEGEKVLEQIKELLQS